ncbi:MAG: hypothetical protein ACK4M5_02245, partial [Dietzia cercidiphylli]
GGALGWAPRHQGPPAIRFLGGWPVAEGVGPGSAPPDRSEALDWIDGLRRGVDQHGTGERGSGERGTGDR